MKRIVWDDSHSVGVDEIDQQHKDFFRIMNRLQLLQERGAPRELTINVLFELYKYADYHFASEENFMALIKCPHLDNQKRNHQEILKSLQEKVRTFNSNALLLEPLLESIATQFLNHADHADKLIGNFVRKISETKTDPFPEPPTGPQGASAA